MKMLIKVLRNALGFLIVLVDLASRGRKQKRSIEDQQAINEELKQLALYQFFACPFCIKTRRALHKLNLPIEKRDASEGTAHRAELLAEGAK